MQTDDPKAIKEKLLAILRDLVARDQALRESYGIGDKFRFIRDRLQALLTKVEQEVMVTAEEGPSKAAMAADEILVYVALYNAHGLDFATWGKMVNPAIFYEYSVNRPVYARRPDVEAFIRGKANKAQHAYLIFAVRQQDLLQSAETSTLKDSYGHTLVRVKEGALKKDKFVAFVHNGSEYVLHPKTGALIKNS